MELNKPKCPYSNVGSNLNCPVLFEINQQREEKDLDKYGPLEHFFFCSCSCTDDMREAAEENDTAQIKELIFAILDK